MITQIVPQLWMLVPREEREYIAQAFGLTKSGITEIKDQEVVTDGYTLEDLKGITLEKMTAFIGSEESFMRAWELTVMRAHSELNPPQVFIGTQEQLNNLRPVSNEEFSQITGQAIDQPKVEDQPTNIPTHASRKTKKGSR